MGGIYAFSELIPAIDPSAFVHPDAIVIGDVIVGAGVYVAPGASLRGDMGRIVVGPGANIQDHCVLHSFPGRDCLVGADGHIGHGAILHGCRIGTNALVGMNAVVMDGADVGDGAFVGAMSFVRAGFSVPPGTLALGTPARVSRTLTPDELAWKARATAAYQELARACRSGLRRCEPLAAPEPDRPRTPPLDGIRPKHELNRLDHR
ncbi:MAG: transferase hexapeptide repeat family protein [Geminicoccaceae bacterium]